jgi:hypothetical protein
MNDPLAAITGEGLVSRMRGAPKRSFKGGRAYPEGMWMVVVVLLVVWAVLSIVGFVFEGLLWLGAIGIVLFIGTLVFGIVRQRAVDARH